MQHKRYKIKNVDSAPELFEQIASCLFNQLPFKPFFQIFFNVEKQVAGL